MWETIILIRNRTTNSILKFCGNLASLFYLLNPLLWVYLAFICLYTWIIWKLFNVSPRERKKEEREWERARAECLCFFAFLFFVILWSRDSLGLGHFSRKWLDLPVDIEAPQRLVWTGEIKWSKSEWSGEYWFTLTTSRRIAELMS